MTVTTHRRSKLNRLGFGDYLIPAFLIFLAMLILIPIWYVLTIALVPQHVFFQTRLLLYPTELTFENFAIVFNNPLFQSGLVNTVIVTIGTTIYSLVLNIAFAYVMLKPIPGRRFFWAFLVFTMFFSGGILPWFLMIVNLGLVNNLLVLILPHGISVFTVILMQSYIRTLPAECEEAARIDGAGDLRVLFSIILPLCKPMIATLALFAAVGGWNRWFEGMMFMQRTELWPLQLVLRNILANANLALEGLPHSARATSFSIGLQMAATITTMLPIICVYPFLQKYFVKGITLGGVKG